MLFQLHWQYEDEKTEMRTQREISNIDEMISFVKETQERHPLPDGTIWMACNQKSKHFLLTNLK